jgi:hypothetical protein
MNVVTFVMECDRCHCLGEAVFGEQDLPKGWTIVAGLDDCPVILCGDCS